MLQVLAPILGTLVDRLIPDKAEAARAKAQIEADLVKAANEVAIAQTEVNKAEAQHRSVWVAGWRPAIGWTCALGFAWAFLGHPLSIWYVTMTGASVTIPSLDTGPLLTMAMGMLGLGGLRTFEKMKGLTK